MADERTVYNEMLTEMKSIFCAATTTQKVYRVFDRRALLTVGATISSERQLATLFFSFLVTRIFLKLSTWEGMQDVESEKETRNRNALRH